jgi:hypothetical protein
MSRVEPKHQAELTGMQQEHNTKAYALELEQTCLHHVNSGLEQEVVAQKANVVKLEATVAETLSTMQTLGREKVLSEKTREQRDLLVTMREMLVRAIWNICLDKQDLTGNQLGNAAWAVEEPKEEVMLQQKKRSK